MHMFRLVLSNLARRPARTVVSMLAVSLGLVLVLLSVGLSYGQLEDAAGRTRRVGGDFLIQGADSSLFFALNSGTLPVQIAAVMEEVEGVEAVTPVLAKFLSHEFHLVFGIDKESFERVNRGLPFVRGRLFEEGAREVIVDTVYSRSKGIGVGDRLEILGEEFRVAGVFQAGTAARVMMPLELLQELNGSPGKATMFFVRVGEENSPEQVFQRLKERLPHYRITKTAELHELMTSTTPVFHQFLTAVVVVSVLISFLMVLLAMYSTITERTREIGILKSLGASRSLIVTLVLKESLLICGLGVLLGFALTGGALQLIVMAFPSVPVSIPGVWRVMSVFLVVAGGGLGALYPAMKAARLDPVKALGYE